MTVGAYPKPLITSRGIAADLRRQIMIDTGEEYLPNITAIFSSDQEKETYPWLSESPVMREWVGGRQPSQLTEKSIEVTNVLYEASMVIPYRRWIRRDKTGQINMRVAQTAQKATQHWAELVSTDIMNGATADAYDGFKYFATNHSEGSSGTQDNSRTSAAATATQPTAGEFADTLLTNTSAIIGYKDTNGKPLQAGLRDFTVMVPPAYLAPAASALGSPSIIYTVGAGAAGNPVNAVSALGGFRYTLVVNPRLTWTDKFVLFANNPLMPAIIRQEEGSIEIQVIGEGSSSEIMNDEWFFGITASRATKLAMWQSAVLHTFT